ncbi:hypothetical protein K1719_044635 [Acacia pycnantha]|nr:hypothetical protein K1719_047059 [Acacia pycnantha]KAI9073402.1 hypothetical protein K1719_044635 [Acacia pycnantha]
MNWHEYPQWSPQNLSTAVPNLEETGLDLLSQMLQYEPSKRISAKKAMEHPYFDQLDKKYLYDVHSCRFTCIPHACPYCRLKFYFRMINIFFPG